MIGATPRMLPHDFENVLVHFFSPGEAKANIVRPLSFAPQRRLTLHQVPTVISVLELFSTVGLFTAMMVRTLEFCLALY